ncbi:MAG: hypothetical protein ACRDN0_29950 [Trebonia sp.]
MRRGARQDGARTFFGEPYLTQGAEDYGETTLVDLDQGALTGLPISGKRWTCSSSASSRRRTPRKSATGPWSGP